MMFLEFKIEMANLHAFAYCGLKTFMIFFFFKLQKYIFKSFMGNINFREVQSKLACNCLLLMRVNGRKVMLSCFQVCSTFRILAETIKPPRFWGPRHCIFHITLYTSVWLSAGGEKKVMSIISSTSLCLIIII